MSCGIALRQPRPRLTALLVIAGVLTHPAWSSHAFSAETAPARLRVAVKPIEPFVIIESGSVRGYSIDVWDSIAAEQNGPDLTDADRQLIDQRLESFLADGYPGVDADAALDSIEQSL